MHFAPVCAAARPVASTKPTCLTADCLSAARSCASASVGATPLPISARPFTPYARSTNDCVATAPTPGSAHATHGPTLKKCDCTATPRSPVTGSRATIEYVCAGIDEPCEPDSGATGTCEYVCFRRQ